MNTCYICGKTHNAGNNIPHSKKKTKRLLRANLQTRKINNKKVKICTRCIKSLKDIKQIKH